MKCRKLVISGWDRFISKWAEVRSAHDSTMQRNRRQCIVDKDNIFSVLLVPYKIVKVRFCQKVSYILENILIWVQYLVTLNAGQEMKKILP